MIEPASHSLNEGFWINFELVGIFSYVKDVLLLYLLASLAIHLNLFQHSIPLLNVIIRVDIFRDLEKSENVPIMASKLFRVGHDLANLKIRN